MSASDRRSPRSTWAHPDDGVVWITGAGRGIGRELALRLARDGFRVAATARTAASLDQLAWANPGRITAFPGDVADAAGMRDIVGAIESGLGPISLAVLNAGVYDTEERGPFDAAVAWRTIDINLGGTLRCVDPLLKVMLPRRRGHIVLTASLAGYGGIPGSIAYAASKAALINVGEGLRLTYERKGIKVQVVNPGFVDTAMTAANDYPMPFMIDAESAARLIAAGLRGNAFEITFPRRLAWLVKGARLLPYPLWMPLMSRATKRTRL